MNRIRSILPVLALALAAAPLLGQTFEVNGPNAVLKVAGQVPSVVDPANHDVIIPLPGSVRIDVESGANLGVGIVVLANFPDQPVPGLFPTPWGGTIDIPQTANTQIIVDSIGNVFGVVQGVQTQVIPSEGPEPRIFFDAPIVSPNPLLEVVDFSMQAVVLDPTVFPFPFDNTEVADIGFTIMRQEVAPTGTDGVVNVPLLTGKSFAFHGTSYTDIFVVANGYVTFGGATTVPNNGFTRDNVAWVNSEPSIAANLTDWSPTANDPADGVTIEETSSLLRVAWGDPAGAINGIAHGGDMDVNQFEIQLELDNTGLPNPLAGTFRIANTMLDPVYTNGFGSGLLGHTPGAPAIAGGAFDVDLHRPQAVGPNTAQLEEHDFTGADNASNVGFDGIGTRRNYNDLTHAWNGGAVQFVPVAPLAIAGDMGYTSTSIGLPIPDAFQGIDLANLSVDGGEVVTLAGVFNGFDPDGSGSGTVIFDPTGAAGGPYPATILGILDATGGAGPLSLPNPAPTPVRDGQGLVIMTPAFAAIGPIDVTVTSDSIGPIGSTITVAPSSTSMTTFGLGDDVFTTHNLLTTSMINFGPYQYSSLHIGSNGIVTLGNGTLDPNVVVTNPNQPMLSFGTGSADFTPSTPEFFAGFRAAPVTTANPGVAVLWTDLNRGGSAVSGATYVVAEDSVANTVQVTYANQRIWSSNEPLGTASVTFSTGAPAVAGNPGERVVTLDYTGVLTTAAATEPGIFVGVTDGENAIGADLDLSDGFGTGLMNALPFQNSNRISVGELMPVNTPFSLGVIEFRDNTGLFTWDIM